MSFVSLQILYMNKQLHNTLKKRQNEIASYDPFKTEAIIQFN